MGSGSRTRRFATFRSSTPFWLRLITVIAGVVASQQRSLLQTLGEETVDPATGFNVRPVRFDKPKFYNETEVVHLRSVCDDSDQTSQTYVCLLIDLPTTLVQFRVELLHCSKASHGGMKAWIERKLHTKTGDTYEPLGEVSFDVTSRSFSYLLKHPEAGYTYRLRWDRPALQATRRNGHKKMSS